METNFATSHPTDLGADHPTDLTAGHPIRAEHPAAQGDFAHPAARTLSRARALLPTPHPTGPPDPRPTPVPSSLTGARAGGVPTPVAPTGDGARPPEYRAEVPDSWGKLPPPPRPPAGAERLRHWREALCERLPMWVRLRCGLELRTVMAVTGVLLAAAGLAVHHFLTGRPRTIAAPSPTRGSVMAPAAQAVDPPDEDQPAEPPDVARPEDAAQVPVTGTTIPVPSPTGVVVVDVAGKVREPGVRKLPAGSRVTDAVRAAGGVIPGTDTSTLNLARLVVDGEQLLVGRPPGAQPAPAAPVGGAAPAPGAPDAPPQPVSLNTATAEQLDALPGVGPVLARRIIEYRAQHGRFTTVAQLRQVSGVGDRRYQDLRALVQP